MGTLPSNTLLGAWASGPHHQWAGQVGRTMKSSSTPHHESCYVTESIFRFIASRSPSSGLMRR